MKKVLLIICILLMYCIPSNAEFTILTIVNDNDKLTEQQRLENIKNIPAKEKLKMLEDMGIPITKVNQANQFISVLYKFPKDAFNDKTSLETFLNAIYAEIVTNGKNLDFYKQRLNKENFNIYYETSMMLVSNPKSVGNLSYKAYDDFYTKLCNGTLDFNNEADRTFYTDFNKELDFSFSGDDEETISQKIEILKEYFSRSEFKNYKIPNEYHIYRLGHNIFTKYNENTADFISRKIKDNNTNLENLCYFLSSIRFNTKISAELEKEFDEGFYNPQTDPFKIFRGKRVIYVNSIDGSNNLIIKAIKDNKINLSANDRLNIEFMTYYYTLSKNNSFTDSVVKEINLIAKDKKIQDKTFAVMAVIYKYYQYSVKDLEEEQRKNTEYMDKLNEKLERFLKENPDFKF